METANETVTGAESVAASGEAEKENNAVTGEESAASKEEGASVEGKAVTEGESAAPGKPDAQARIRQLAEKAAYWQGVAEGRVQKPEVKPEPDANLSEINRVNALIQKANAAGITADKYSTYDAYQVALNVWVNREDQNEKEQVRKAESEKQIMAEKITKAEEKYPDFKSVALNPDVPITSAMYEAIKGSEIGADLAYYLGKHPDEATRIAQMNPFSAVRELGKLEVKLTQPPVETKKITAAPAPLSTVTGNGGHRADAFDEGLSTEDRIRMWRKG